MVPQAFPAFVSSVLYMLDINIRASTILGIVGGGGIGFLLFNSLRVRVFQTTGAILIAIFVIVLRNRAPLGLGPQAAPVTREHHDSIEGAAMMQNVRTTVTLDPDVAAKLKQVARDRGVSFKAALNDAVRAGLGTEARSPRRYRLRTRKMGAMRGVDLDKALRLAAELEDAELLRKLELRK